MMFPDYVVVFHSVFVKVVLAHIDVLQFSVVHRDGASIVFNDVTHQVMRMNQRFLCLLAFGDVFPQH